MRSDARRGVGRAGDVRVAEHDQRLGGGLGDQAQLRVQDRDQGALAAGQRPGDVEALLGQQRVQVVARYPARDLRVALADLIRAGLRQFPQGAVDPGAPAAGRDDGRVLLVAGRPGPEPLPVVGQHLEPDHVVHGLAVGLRGRAARVVADHAAQRAVIVGGRLRAEHQPVRRQLGVELVQHDAGLDHAGPRRRIDADQAVAVLGPVDDHRHVARLPGQAGAAATGHHRRAVLPAHGDGRHRVVHGAGNHDADRYLAVVRGVGAVRAAAARVEPDLAAGPLPQGALERPGVDLRRPGAADDRIRQGHAGHERLLSG